MTLNLDALETAARIVAEGRAYTRENYPVGHPGKYVGDTPADEFDAAVDDVVAAQPDLLRIARAAKAWAEAIRGQAGEQTATVRKTQGHLLMAIFGLSGETAGETT